MASAVAVAEGVVAAEVVVVVVWWLCDPRAWITHPPFDPYPMDRGMDRVWVWVCDPSLMFLAVARCY